VTRDYELVLDEHRGEAPLLTIYGGKITTHRKLAEAAMAKVGKFFEALPPWTAGSTLPGGDFAPDGFYPLVAETIGRWPFLSEPHARRLVRAYGRRVERILGDARSMQDLGVCFTGNLTAVEARYLVDNEWAQTADDVLWRRSKLGLKATPEECNALERFIATLSEETARPTPA
jgi:glycerol-3-phosphate dehydrogenase